MNLIANDRFCKEIEPIEQWLTMVNYYEGTILNLLYSAQFKISQTFFIVFTFIPLFHKQLYLNL